MAAPMMRDMALAVEYCIHPSRCGASIVCNVAEHLAVEDDE